MALELTGRLYEKFPKQQIKENFSKREFVLEISEQGANGMMYTNYAAFQLVNAQCDLIENFNLGDMVTVSFNVRGNKWEKDGQVKYITNLNAWRIQQANAATGLPTQGAGQQSAPTNTYNAAAPVAPTAPTNMGNMAEEADDLPF